ncbi:MAG: NTP transferase domain-containing protein [Erythrobacter sp.]|jgi:CTP:molybdopterin cytidylyltransferase MocA|nr:NTP transferase domain-containing protein [Erythrobacter sp.]
MRLGGAILAAGASLRFGEADKLAIDYRGSRLGEHAAKGLAGAGLMPRWAIVAVPDHPCAAGWRAHGFVVEVNPLAAQGMGTSVALAARLARAAGCEGLIIALADMPEVPPEHFLALAARVAARGPDAIITSALEGARLPPAAFGQAHFPMLEALGGDCGARALLRDGEVLDCPPEWLADVDSPGDLARLREVGGKRPPMQSSPE